MGYQIILILSTFITFTRTEFCQKQSRNDIFFYCKVGKYTFVRENLVIGLLLQLVSNRIMQCSGTWLVLVLLGAGAGPRRGSVSVPSIMLLLILLLLLLLFLQNFLLPSLLNPHLFPLLVMLLLVQLLLLILLTDVTPVILMYSS